MSDSPTDAVTFECLVLYYLHLQTRKEKREEYKNDVLGYSLSRSDKD